MTGSVSILDPVPSITNIGLYDGNGNAATAMDPQMPYTLLIPVTDYNGLNDIAEIDVTIYQDYGTTPLDSWNSSNNVTYKWKSASGWDMYNGASTFSDTTWTLRPDSVTPALTGSSGTWVLSFAPGELAACTSWITGPAAWAISVKVIDNETNYDTASIADLVMNQYIAMSVVNGSGAAVSTVEFGNLAPGNSTLMQTPSAIYTSVKTNDVYALEASTGNWTSANNGLITPVSTFTGADQFRLLIDDATSGSALVTPQALPTLGGGITGYTYLEAPTTGIGAAETPDLNDFYLQIELGQPITVQATYNGTITITAGNLQT